jgi:hypothetical protein
MAYNSGKIEATLAKITPNLVNIDGDQVIEGQKEFSKPIKARGFYDTDKDKLLIPPAISSIEADRKNALFVSNGNGTVRAYGGLIFNGESLKSPSYFGSGVGLTNLQSTALVGQIPMENLNYGTSLTSQNSCLQVNVSSGLVVTDEGVGIHLSSVGPLKAGLTGLDFNPTYAPLKNSVSVKDNLLIADSDNENTVKRVTMQQLAKYFQYSLHFTKPHGGAGQLQFNNRGRFGTNPSLSFRGDTLFAFNMSIQSQLQVGNTFLRSDRAIVALPNDPLDNSQLPNNAFSLFLDEENDKLMLSVKYSTGVVRNVSIDLIKRALVQEEDDETENQGFMLDEEIVDEAIEATPFEDMESTAVEKANSSTGGIMGYFKSAFTKK